jgi:hypothetical protein
VEEVCCVWVDHWSCSFNCELTGGSKSSHAELYTWQVRCHVVAETYCFCCCLSVIPPSPQEHWEREYPDLQLEFDIPFR